MLPNMKRVIKRKEQPIIFTSTVQAVVGVTPTITEVDTPLRGCLQVATSETLKNLNIDYSQSYYQLHIRNEVLEQNNIDIKTIDKIKNYKNQEFRVIQVRNYSEYGYVEMIIEEIKE